MKLVVLLLMVSLVGDGGVMVGMVVVLLAASFVFEERLC